MYNTVPEQNTKPDIGQLVDFFLNRHPLFVLTGAGCSVDSGIPDYRDRNGEWKHAAPIQFNDFIKHDSMRKRYWARSMNGWPHIAKARPNAAHHALARLQQAGYIKQLVTQNVDGLHQHAGSEQVINLHGQLQTVSCLNCHEQISRLDMQEQLIKHNGGFIRSSNTIKPDGDADSGLHDLSDFHIPACRRCGGILKPDVVFFGESVPRADVNEAMQALKQAGGMLTVGSSLMVFSGYRFCRAAREWDIPCAALNLGRTRADDDLVLKVESDCGETLSTLVRALKC